MLYGLASTPHDLFSSALSVQSNLYALFATLPPSLVISIAMDSKLLLDQMTFLGQWILSES